jgi:hypothetical protein
VISVRDPNACASVPRSTYSNSPPSGTPCARRLGRTPVGELRQVVRGGLAFDGGVGGDDHLARLARGQAFGQLVQAQLARADAVERGKPALQHEVQPAVAGGLFDHQAVGR